MNWLRYGVLAAALALVACGQQQAPQTDTTATVAPMEEEAEAPAPELPQVDPVLLAAPDTDFNAIEPSEVGVSAAPTVMDALAPLLGPELTEGADEVSLTVRENGDQATADLVRSGLQDDSVRAGHVRIVFHHEADGWHPTNAYRRSQCQRGGQAGQWTTGLCP